MRSSRPDFETLPTSYDLGYLPLGSAAFGGAERSLIDLAGAMAARGKRVLVFAEEALRPTAFPRLAAERGVDLVWVSWRPEEGNFTNVLEAFKCFRRYRCSVIHFNIAWRDRMWTIPWVAKVASGAHLVGTMRAMPDPHNRVPRRLHFGVIPGLQLWRLTDIITGWSWARTLAVTVSVNREDFPTRLARDFGFARNRIQVIFNGVRVPTFDDPAQVRTRVCRSLGLPIENFLVCIAGRVSKEKGIDVMLRAMRQLSFEVHSIVVGDGPFEQEAKALAQELGLAGRVHFVGFQENPYEFMRASDVVAVPSVWEEAFGRVVAEAMCLGVPVVASRVGGMAELFEHEQEGLYVPVGDARALASAIQRLQTDTALRLRMGEAAKRAGEDRYSLRRVVDEYAALYQRIARCE